MKMIHKKRFMKFKAFLLAIIISVNSMNSLIMIKAAVKDNLGSAVVEQTIGSWSDTLESHSVIGLLRLIIDKITTQLGKIESLETRVEAMDKKIDLQTTSLQESIESSFVTATASYNLFVYIPKTEALADYTNQKITLTSESGNQASATTLKDTGMNYSSTIYFNFSGNCQLTWTAINALGDEYVLTEDIFISNASQEFKLGSVAHRLKVFFPKSVALYAYDDEPITLVTEKKSVSSRLKDDGTNYSAILYSDFDGVANLCYDFLDETGTRVAIEEPLKLTDSQMELEIGLNSLEPKEMSWKTIHTICQSNRASLFFENGDEMPGGWMLVGMGQDDDGKDALQLWKKINLGNQGWGSACNAAGNYYTTWNTEQNTTIAFKSSLLSQPDMESGWLAVQSNRAAGEFYWLITPQYTGGHYCVRSDGTVAYTTDSKSDTDCSFGCYPCVWIH
ncbi:MAG: hypothetical protein MSA09_13035 [Lachnospiraceae bacterium]|nr:hypothetical protein [Lachnospiraceae bacterium]MDD7177833.1 hypothetical protein [bacterium]MDY5517070.1 hypothetical protein [Lachnospiraceae bacterium]